jgi:multidrug resistance efflux pump
MALKLLSRLRVTRRFLRVGLAFACALLAGIAIILHATHIVTADAVLDGRRIVVRAQIDGRVMEGAPKVGAVIEKNDIVATVVAQMADRRTVMSAHAERDEMEAKLAALDGERDRLEALRQQLQLEVSRFTDVALRRVNAEIQAAASNVESADASYRVAHAEADRARKMMGTGSMGASDIDQRIGHEDEARQQLVAAQADLLRISAEAAGYAVGVNARDGQNNVPYSRQRLDEIAIRLSDIAGERAALVARDRSLALEISREDDWLTMQTRSENRAIDQAVVWRRPVAAGTDVAKGDVLVELVDCADMFVLARMPLDDAAVIAPGDPVSIELAGKHATVAGEVRIVRGSASAQPRGSEASGLEAPGSERFAEVEIAVDPRSIAAGGGNLCGIGTGVRVWFSPPSLLSTLLPRI